MIVIDSGQQRALSASAYNTRRDECRRAAELLNVPSLREVADPARIEALPSPLRERARHVVSENRRVVMATRGQPVVYGLLAFRIVEECRRRGIPCAVPSSVSIFDCIPSTQPSHWSVTFPMLAVKSRECLRSA